MLKQESLVRSLPEEVNVFINNRTPAARFTDFATPIAMECFALVIF